MPGPRVIEYLTKPDGTVVDVQGEWDAFAFENDTPELTSASVVGRTLGDFMGGSETRLIYRALVERVMQTAAAVRFPFRCDSPSHRRHMEMEVEQADPELIRFRSRVVHEQERPAQLLLSSTVERSDELLVMCSWCKRVKTEAGLWVEVEDYLETSGLMEATVLPRLSHGACPECERKMDALLEAAE
jgi:hypothetical protein